MQFLENAGANYQKLRQEHVPEDGIRYPFSSDRKRMSTMVNTS